ncbi:MAG: hypothetical protein VKP57_03090 [Candidatus Sericytochromatia bacterium]|nr:hypothetical protein [Candidatus Sericytochromatia bacterium]
MNELVPDLISVEEFSALPEGEQEAYLEARRQDLAQLIKKAEGRKAVVMKKVLDAMATQNAFIATLDQEIASFRSMKAAFPLDPAQPGLLRWHHHMDLGIELKQNLRTKSLLRIADMTEDLRSLETSFADGIQVDDPQQTVAYRKADALADLAALRFHLMELAVVHRLLAEVLKVPFQPEEDDVTWRVTQAALPKAANAGRAASGATTTSGLPSSSAVPAATSKGLSSLSLDDGGGLVGLGDPLAGLGGGGTGLDGLPPLPAVVPLAEVEGEVEDAASPDVDGTDGNSVAEAGDPSDVPDPDGAAEAPVFDDLNWVPDISDTLRVEAREALEALFAGNVEARIRASALADSLFEARADAHVARVLLKELVSGSVGQAARILSMPVWTQLDGRVTAVLGAHKLVAEVPELARLFPAETDLRDECLRYGFEPPPAD